LASGIRPHLSGEEGSNIEAYSILHKEKGTNLLHLFPPISHWGEKGGAMRFITYRFIAERECWNYNCADGTLLLLMEERPARLANRRYQAEREKKGLRQQSSRRSSQGEKKITLFSLYKKDRPVRPRLTRKAIVWPKKGKRERSRGGVILIRCVAKKTCSLLGGGGGVRRGGGYLTRFGDLERSASRRRGERKGRKLGRSLLLDLQALSRER